MPALRRTSSLSFSSLCSRASFKNTCGMSTPRPAGNHRDGDTRTERMGGVSSSKSVKEVWSVSVVCLPAPRASVARLAGLQLSLAAEQNHLDQWQWDCSKAANCHCRASLCSGALPEYCPPSAAAAAAAVSSAAVAATSASVARLTCTGREGQRGREGGERKGEEGKREEGEVLVAGVQI